MEKAGLTPMISYSVCLSRVKEPPFTDRLRGMRL